MKRLLLWLCLVLAGTLGLQAQAPVDVTGTWQGTMQPQGAPREMRIVMKVSKDDGVLKVAAYLVDQGGNALNANSAALKGDTFTFEVAGMAAKYEAKVAADGKSMTGTFSIAERPTALNLAKVNPEAAWEIPKPPPPIKPMAKDFDPTFEVATVKPSNPGEQRILFAPGRDRFRTIGTTLVDMLKFVYQLQDKQMTGLPSWAGEQKWDVDGKPDGEGRPSMDQWRSAMKKLLVERFQMKFHEEDREMPVYILELAKSGPKMSKNTGAPDGPSGMLFRGPGIFTAQNATMFDFSTLLQSTLLDRPVLDKTGLGEAHYDFTLTWQPDATQFGGRFANAPVFDPPRPDLYTALQEQLGVKATPTKAPAKVMVFEKVEKPSEN
ncbi:TIGR03435 family protein [Terriglobus albidus]|uniref:TIGR03435 family protein n=1 Tax=Terriglobus albidus TaxID=1592106 RepID=A0A5B9E3Q8_9BACT|nr:TIGR03435 family protein [Terriglobus albidus]QEE26892.1 TIGR03435 family protein [Terriglobus albidus]